jgi:hypothetical protein
MSATPQEPTGRARRKQRTSELEGDIEVKDLQKAYVQRLRRLLRLRRDHHPQLNEVGLRLLDRSIFAAYCDCLDVGAGSLAQHLLRDEQLEALGSLLRDSADAGLG